MYLAPLAWTVSDKMESAGSRFADNLVPKHHNILFPYATCLLASETGLQEECYNINNLRSKFLEPVTTAALIIIWWFLDVKTHTSKSKLKVF